MRKLLVLMIVAGTALVAFFGVDSLRDATDRVVQAGQGAFDAGRAVVDAGGDAVSGVRDTAEAVDQLAGACDLVRTAIRPETPPEESADLLGQALGIVDSVVLTYPEVPGVSDLQGAVGTARGVLAADPTGQALKANAAAVESTCAQIPSLP